MHPEVLVYRKLQLFLVVQIAGSEVPYKNAHVMLRILGHKTTL